MAVAMDDIKVGQVWQGKTTNHMYPVRVVRLMSNSVYIEKTGGAGKHSGHRISLTLDKFVNQFELQRDVKGAKPVADVVQEKTATSYTTKWRESNALRAINANVTDDVYTMYQSMRGSTTHADFVAELLLESSSQRGFEALMRPYMERHNLPNLTEAIRHATQNAEAAIGTTPIFQGKIDSQAKRIDDQSDRIAVLESEVRSLNGDLGIEKGKTTEAQARQAEAERKSAESKRGMEAAKRELDAVKGKLRNQDEMSDLLRAHLGRIAELEREVDNLGRQDLGTEVASRAPSEDVKDVLFELISALEGTEAVYRSGKFEVRIVGDQAMTILGLGEKAAELLQEEK